MLQHLAWVCDKLLVDLIKRRRQRDTSGGSGGALLRPWPLRVPLSSPRANITWNSTHFVALIAISPVANLRWKLLMQEAGFELFMQMKLRVALSSFPSCGCLHRELGRRINELPRPKAREGEGRGRKLLSNLFLSVQSWQVEAKIYRKTFFYFSSFSRSNLWCSGQRSSRFWEIQFTQLLGCSIRLMVRSSLWQEATSRHHYFLPEGLLHHTSFHSTSMLSSLDDSHSRGSQRASADFLFAQFCFCSAERK